ncbi:hypothetical protein HK102_006742, partial [Quaeritorhiza haematococci]
MITFKSSYTLTLALLASISLSSTLTTALPNPHPNPHLLQKLDTIERGDSESVFSLTPIIPSLPPHQLLNNDQEDHPTTNFAAAAPGGDTQSNVILVPNAQNKRPDSISTSRPTSKNK